MATQIVMNHTGDTRHNFDPKDVQAVLKGRGSVQRTDAFRLYGGGPHAFRGGDCDAHV
jgi:hypothetical protein